MSCRTTVSRLLMFALFLLLATAAQAQVDPCEGVECNHGACVSTEEGDAICECNDGYTGEDCNTPIDPCEGVECNHGACVPTEEGSAICECNDGYTGEDCNTPSDLPPDCSNATASPNLLWPPNHRFVPIQINPVPGAVTVSVTSIFQDEPVQSPGSGNTSPDATVVGTANPFVRAERDGGFDGRVYHIAFTATGAGGSCTGNVTVGVPKSQGNNGGPVDQGALYNSMLP